MKLKLRLCVASTALAFALLAGCGKETSTFSSVAISVKDISIKDLTLPQPKEKASKKTDKQKYIRNCPWSKKIQKRIKRLCERRGVDFHLVMSMAYTESRFNGQAIGDGGQAFGAWQIHPAEWKEEIARFGYDAEDMLDVAKQAHVLTYLMQAHLDRFDGDERAALMAWNGSGDYASAMMQKGVVSSYAKEILSRKKKYKYHCTTSSGSRSKH